MKKNVKFIKYLNELRSQVLQRLTTTVEDEAANRTLLHDLTEKERQYILIGRVLSGMSKKGVILALGYPPVHRTSSLNNPIWRYWNSILGTFTVQFLDDKTIELNSIK